MQWPIVHDDHERSDSEQVGAGAEQANTQPDRTSPRSRRHQEFCDDGFASWRSACCLWLRAEGDTSCIPGEQDAEGYG